MVNYHWWTLSRKRWAQLSLITVLLPVGLRKFLSRVAWSRTLATATLWLGTQSTPDFLRRAMITLAWMIAVWWYGTLSKVWINTSIGSGSVKRIEPFRLVSHRGKIWGKLRLALALRLSQISARDIKIIFRMLMMTFIRYVGYLRVSMSSYTRQRARYRYVIQDKDLVKKLSLLKRLKANKFSTWSLTLLTRGGLRQWLKTKFLFLIWGLLTKFFSALKVNKSKRKIFHHWKNIPKVFLDSIGAWTARTCWRPTLRPQVW